MVNWLVWLDVPLFINEKIGLSENKVSIFPNPSSDFLKFELNNETNFTSWEIVSLSGRIIITGKIKSGYNSINLTDISRGTYLLNLKTENGVLNKKIVRQ
ncbi:T9SS type A sorting domain-containing protein [Salibacter halophilus]|uniref:T9SS type A sorting domain-containing protein n=1 Tax=Salibacter halophilus TaxID=1803916 RepID=A0A6N6M2J8_9FLAO|nr:T9SS type A sorting domain-containing protein [Salibacter halophilus]KAB1063201.1 T9SS type A sorting domain-containing protein [Salibacter halophilus]